MGYMGILSNIPKAIFYLLKNTSTSLKKTWCSHATESPFWIFSRSCCRVPARSIVSPKQASYPIKAIKVLIKIPCTSPLPLSS